MLLCPTLDIIGRFANTMQPWKPSSWWSLVTSTPASRRRLAYISPSSLRTSNSHVMTYALGVLPRTSCSASRGAALTSISPGTLLTTPGDPFSLTTILKCFLRSAGSMAVQFSLERVLKLMFGSSRELWLFSSRTGTSEILAPKY